MRALSLGLLVWVGCGGSSTGTIVPDSGMTVETHPKIAVAPLKLEFGVLTTASATKTVTVENTGDGTLKVGKLVLSSPVQFDAKLREGTGELAPGGKAEIDVKFTPDGYGPRAATLKILSNDVDVTVAISGETVAPDACAFTVAPSLLAFGKLMEGATKDLSFTISVTKGTCALNGAGLTASTNAAFTLPEGTLGARTLTAGETITVPVRAKGPAVSGNFTGSVLVLFDGQLQTSVALTANVQTGDCLRVVPGTLVFETTALTCTSPLKSVTITNQCPDALTISSVSVGPTFVVSPTTPLAAGTVFAPSASRVFQLRFQPTQATVVTTGKLTLKSTQYGTDTNSELPLSGSAVQMATVVQGFTEFPPVRSDTLFVIDTSASMASVQSNTLANLAIAFDALAGIDSQLAITTADPANGGKIIGDAMNPALITPAVPNAKAKFLQKFTQLSLDAGTPQQLAMAELATSPALLAGTNAGLWRQAGARTIVIVTDTDDHSPLPVASYVSNIVAEVSLISRFGQGCGPVNPLLPRLETAAQGLGAFTGDLCDPTWSGLYALVINPFPPRTTFFLEEVPNLQTLIVRVNNVAVPSTTVTVPTWMYDPILNAVSFDAAYPLLPGPGPTVINLEYLPACP